MISTELLAAIPQLAEIHPDAVRWQQLGGLTNDNYRLSGNNFDYILRLPRESTNRWIDRQTERHNLELAVASGLAPNYHYFARDGLLLSNHLAGAVELTSKELHNPALLQKVVAQVKRLHLLQPGFRGRVDLADLINRYYGLMSVSDQQLLADFYEEIKVTLEEAIGNDPPDVSSHNDLVLQNLLLQGERLWMIDWEYSSRASPYWDLATLCNEAAFDESAADEILEIYAGGKSNLQARQLNRYRTLLRFLGDCWFRAFHPSC